MEDAESSPASHHNDDDQTIDQSSDEDGVDAHDGATSTSGDGKTKTPARKGKARLNYLASHKVIEKKRRDRINNALSTLGRIVPECAQFASKKLDKALTLENTIAYIERIQQGNMAGMVQQQPQRPGSTRQVVTAIGQWANENRLVYPSTNQFVKGLLQMLSSLPGEEDATAMKVKRENEATQLAGPSLVLGPMVPPVLPLQPGSAAPRYDGRPPLLPVVQPPQGAFNAAMYQAAQMRPPSGDGMPADNHVLWAQQNLILQQSMLHQPNVAYSSFLNTGSPAPMPMSAPAYIPSSSQADGTFSPAATSAQAAVHDRSGDVFRSDIPPPRAQPQVTFATSVAASARDKGRPNILNLGPTMQASAVATPSAFSTVSTPRGANTPGGDDTLGLQSPNIAKSFPFAAGSVQTPNRAFRQKTAPGPLNLDGPTTLPPDFGVKTSAAITPQRQSLAKSLLELSGQAASPFDPQPVNLLASAGFKEPGVILSSANTSVEDALGSLPANPQLLMNAPAMQNQLLQQFSSRLQETMQGQLQLQVSNGGDFSSTTVTPGVPEPETPVGMPMLTADKHNLSGAHRLDGSRPDAAEWVSLQPPSKQDDDNSQPLQSSGEPDAKKKKVDPSARRRDA